MKRIFLLAIIVLVSASAFTQSQPARQTFDIVILHGRVMDPESGLDAVRNVGINGTRIAAITEDQIHGKKTIDAHGLVVAPASLTCTRTARTRKTTATKPWTVSLQRWSSKLA